MDEYTHLRTLLLEDEQQRLARLEYRLDDATQRSQEMAAVLPTAVAAVPDQPALAAALQTPVTQCVHHFIKKDPHSLVKAIWPAMAPELRKQIAEAFKSIREFLQTQQTHLDVLEKRLGDLEQAKITAILQQLQQLEQAMMRFQVVESYLQDTDKRVQEIAQMLPEAIRQAAEQLPPPEQLQADGTTVIRTETELTESLRIPVELCIRQSISENTHTFADTLFPVMGPAIRKSINESLKSLIHSINTSLEQSFSLRGIGWRLEALRTGRPFGEIVLQRTLAYRVEQTFLIHRETGLLIQHLYQEEIEIGDSEAVSAMLTAIQDFIRDSFSTSKTEELDSVEIGEYTVWLERGPHAVLACVIRGVASYDFRYLMRSLLELMHAKYGRLLELFNGDTAPLEPCRPLLQRTLQSKLKPGEETSKRLFSAKFIITVATLLLAFTSWSYVKFTTHQRLSDYLETLNRTPGLVVVEHDFQGQQLVIRGLRDPLAADPQQLAHQAAVADTEIVSTWTLYHDLTPAFVEQRLRHWLQAPPTVRWQLNGAVLNLSGHAPAAWIERASHAQGIVAGVNQVKMDNLVDTDQFLLKQAREILQPPASVRLTVTAGVLKISGFADKATRELLQQRTDMLQGFAGVDLKELINDPREVFAQLVQHIEGTPIYFSEDASFSPEQEVVLENLIKDILQLFAISTDLSITTRLQITGYTDGLGSQTRNQRLSQQRAETVYNWLLTQGIVAANLMIVPPAAVRFDEKQPILKDRKVVLRVEKPKKN